MTSLWIVGIRFQSERNILLECRFFRMYVTLKSYMNKDRNWSQSIVMSYWDGHYSLYSPRFKFFTFRK